VATIKRVGGGKRTVGALNSTMADAFVPGWDSKPSGAQKRDHVVARTAMGKKETPVGRTRLRRS
jgi:hypothetical protein